MINSNIDILFISDTKIDGAFPTSQFLMSGRSNVYQLDRNDKEWGVILFVKDNLLTFPVIRVWFPGKNRKTDIFSVELNLGKKKDWYFAVTML